MNDHFLLKVNHPNLCSSRITSSLGQALGYRRSQQQYRSRFDINPTSYLRFSASNSQFAARLDVVGGGYGRIECSGHRCRCRSADEQHADNEAGGGQSFIFRYSCQLQPHSRQVCSLFKESSADSFWWCADQPQWTGTLPLLRCQRSQHWLQIQLHRL